MPVGGSNTTGMWGYIEAFRELLDQVEFNKYYTYTFIDSHLSCIESN